MSNETQVSSKVQQQEASGREPIRSRVDFVLVFSVDNANPKFGAPHASITSHKPVNTRPSRPRSIPTPYQTTPPPPFSSRCPLSTAPSPGMPLPESHQTPPRPPKTLLSPVWTPLSPRFRRKGRLPGRLARLWAFPEAVAAPLPSRRPWQPTLPIPQTTPNYPKLPKITTKFSPRAR